MLSCPTLAPVQPWWGSSWRTPAAAEWSPQETRLGPTWSCLHTPGSHTRITEQTSYSRYVCCWFFCISMYSWVWLTYWKPYQLLVCVFTITISSVKNSCLLICIVVYWYAVWCINTAYINDYILYTSPGQKFVLLAGERNSSPLDTFRSFSHCTRGSQIALTSFKHSIDLQ